MLTERPMSSGGFEYESYQRLVQRGLQPQRLDAKMIENRFPVFRAGAFADGFFDVNGGYVESGRAVNALATYAQSRGIQVHENQRVTTLIEDGQRVTGIQVSSGNIFRAEHVVVAAGAWTFTLLPELQPVMKASGQSVFHLKPLNPEAYAAPQLPVFTADISRTGWYGFPLHPFEGVFKVARHTTGLPVDPNDMPVDVPLSHHKTLRRFLENVLPDLSNAPVVYTRVCLYCDTFDGHLWITRHMYRNGLTVAAGGSGHGFKFGSVLGKIVADVVEDRPNPYRSKFAWRFPENGHVYGQEEARHRE
jgi:glycine/D-amino acid oxidase-like deaminating enzyme